jgi:heme-degrading monooxygenase HmoA
MKRRTYFKAMLATILSSHLAEAKEQAVDLHLDLAVDPAKEKEMLKNFHTVFRPAAAKQPGFVDSKMLKLNSTLQGSAPAGANYRFMISFASEADRKKWVATPVHQRVWPLIENSLTSKNYTILLYGVS